MNLVINIFAFIIVSPLIIVAVLVAFEFLVMNAPFLCVAGLCLFLYIKEIKKKCSQMYSKHQAQIKKDYSAIAKFLP